MGNLFAHCIGVVPRVSGLHAETATPASSPIQQQPPTSPSDWFLTPDEITKSRGGERRSDLSLYSTGDHVIAFASSDAYFRKLLDDMNATNVRSIWIAGWSLNHMVPLDPTSSHSATTTLQAVVERAVRQRHVHVRALVWANLFTRKECLATRDWMNALGSSSAQGSALMLFDNRLPHKTSSHHQKCVVIQRTSGEFVAFMGGLDITVDRWDTLSHNETSLRAQSGWKGEFDGWLDGAVRLEGTSARDVAATFAARWNLSPKPANCWKEELLDFENPTSYESIQSPDPPSTIVGATVATSTNSSLSVQIVRTFSPVRAAKKLGGLAPKGELSLLHSRVKAIGFAKSWIFIEDQYFFFMPQLMTALRTALASHPSLQVVVVVQAPTITTQSKFAGYEKLLFETVHPLLEAFTPRVHVYTTKSERKLYIHTKVVIVDDVFLSIGSANWNRRSMTSDSELAANIVDADLVGTPNGIRVGKFVRNYQLRKLEELTNRSVDAIRGLTAAQRCDLLAQAAIEGPTILQKLEVEEKWEFVVFPEEYTLHVVDPDDVNHTEHAESSSDEEP